MNENSNYGRSLTAFLCGTLLSIVLGLLLANHFPSPYQYVIGLLSEILVVALSLGMLLYELNTRVLLAIRDRDILVAAADFAATSGDPCFRNRLQDIRHQLAELSIGRYALSDLHAVYSDDIESIKILTAGQKLCSMCPVGGGPADVALQFSNKSFTASMDEHYNAAEHRQVIVERIYVFERQRLLVDVAECRSHLDEAAGRKVNVRLIFLDDPRFGHALTLPRDFIIFGENKVSVGLIGENSRVDGAAVSAERDTILSYRRKFEQLLMQSEAYSEYQRRDPVVVRK
jgi:hypothetical protein